MCHFVYKGKRIRASDQHLILRFAATSLGLVFLLVLLAFHGKWLMHTDWQKVRLLRDGQFQFFITPYLIFSVLAAAGVCLLAAYLFYHFQRDHVNRLMHCQKLAKMILENKWYESEQVQHEGFFKDWPSGKSKEKITHFPRMYYRLKDGLIHIHVEIPLGKYQDQLLHLEKKLESGLYCELVDKELKDAYIEYTLLYDMIANRITIDEVRAEHGRLRLMRNVWWDYDQLPHMLIAGGTGGGKTYFIFSLIEALARTNAVLYVLDPKNADLADLSEV
ncbi:FtsK/SpoIIIE domain-containing protein, partial [Sporolactobacillus shoreicorticis]